MVRDPQPGQRLDLRRDRRVLRSTATLSVPVPANCPNLPGRQTCDHPTRPVPASTMMVPVFGDDILLYDSGILRSGTPAKLSTADTIGVRMLSLRVTDGGDGRNFDHADWADARVTCD